MALDAATLAKVHDLLGRIGATGDAASGTGNAMQRLAAIRDYVDTLEAVAGQIKVKTDLIETSGQEFYTFTNVKLPNAPANLYDLVSDRVQYLYAVTSGSNILRRYDTLAGAWDTSLAVAPANFGAGATLVYANGDIYALQGASTAVFWKYNIASNTWIALANMSTTAVTDGTCLVWTGGDYIYAGYGQATVTNFFFRYSISGNSWTQMAGALFNWSGIPNNMVFDGDSTIYAGMDAGGQIAAYDIISNTWYAAGRGAGRSSIYYFGGRYIYRYAYSTVGGTEKDIELFDRYTGEIKTNKSVLSVDGTGAKTVTMQNGDAYTMQRGTNGFYKNRGKVSSSPITSPWLR